MPASFPMGYKSAYRVPEIYIENICNRVRSNFMKTGQQGDTAKVISQMKIAYGREFWKERGVGEREGGSE